ncbi:hypothetical protein QOZ84_10245 [Romboutsia sedimentorum]|uniref:Uncharacterized protein n=1 Tax=Romboutsia sedimentorum TaxID=1368474 RepID=A0ABT7EDB1_9FIRM|nr:ABC-three component system middle component 1 [Romboutsia sedimentorum]MDK2563931.1 hypothetical protein [Romboutsia sedimentorum]
MIVRKIDSILRENKFKIVEEKKIKSLDLIYYKNNHINVFLGNQDYSTIGFEEINNLAYHLREVLIDSDINLYNSYLIYCIDNGGIKEEEIILLERNSKYLRKYIIRQIEDMDRLFFLNNASNKVDIDINKIPKINEDMKQIINKMVYDEKISKLDSKKIDLIVNNILENLGDNYEN